MTETEDISATERSYGAAAHVAPLAWGNVVPVFGSLAVTLLVWWWMRESGFVVQARSRFDQLPAFSMTVHYALAFGYVFVCLVSFGMLLLAAAAMIFETVSIGAGRRDVPRQAEHYQYRLCLEFVKDVDVEVRAERSYLIVAITLSGLAVIYPWDGWLGDGMSLDPRLRTLALVCGAGWTFRIAFACDRA